MISEISKRFGILILIISCAQLAYGQEMNLDSLYGIWKDRTKNDSLRANAYGDYIYYKHQENPDSFIILGKELSDFGNSNNILHGLYEGYYLMGYGYFVMNDFVNAIKFFQRSYNLRPEVHPTTATILGMVKVQTGDTIGGILLMRRALIISKKEGDEVKIAGFLSNLATMNRDLGRLDSAMAYLDEAFIRISKIDNQDQLTLNFKANILANFASIHLILKEYEKALEASENATKAYLEYQPESTPFVHCIMATSFLNLGNNEEAIHNAKKAIELAEKYFPREILEAYQCAYECYKEIGSWEKALEILEEINKIRDENSEVEINKQMMLSKFKNQSKNDSLENVAKELLLEKNYNEKIRKKNQIQNLALGGSLLLLLGIIGVYNRLRFTRKAKTEIELEKRRSDELLLNILPAEVAEELKNTGESEAQHFDEVSILFTDFKSFTQTAEKLSAKELVNEINTCFKAFDNICEKYGIEKIKTIGDSYMCAAGLRKSDEKRVNNNESAISLTKAALEMQQFITARGLELEVKGSKGFQMRCGIHTGPVVAGIVGVKKFQYDIWGDTVNTASRMESHGEEGKVNISEATFQIIKDEPEFIFDERAELEVKGKGRMKMFFTSITKKTF